MLKKTSNLTAAIVSSLPSTNKTSPIAVSKYEKAGFKVLQSSLISLDLFQDCQDYLYLRKRACCIFSFTKANHKDFDLLILDQAI